MQEHQDILFKRFGLVWIVYPKTVFVYSNCPLGVYEIYAIEKIINIKNISKELFQFMQNARKPPCQ